MPRLMMMAFFVLIMIFAIAKIAGAEDPTPTLTPITCADDEERLEDGTCQQVFPPEEFPPKVGTAWSITPEPESCQEDDPCWDCATMGNRICGPTSLPDTGGAPDKPCRNWTTGQAGDISTPCPTAKSFFKRFGLDDLSAVGGAALLLGGLLLLTLVKRKAGK